MKPILSLVFVLAMFSAQAQKPELDKSPMDMSYLPNGYPLLKKNGKAKDLPVARVLYGRPSKNGRPIFGGLNKYDELWRLGANEATEIEFFTNVKIGGKTVPKGRYTMYCIPEETRWTLIINKDNFSWGSFTYDAKKDLLRTDVAVEKTQEVVEAFTIYFEDTKNGGNMIFLWDDVKAVLPITVSGK
jgi:hypothetical protein